MKGNETEIGSKAIANEWWIKQNTWMHKESKDANSFFKLSRIIP